jgi:DNA-binding NarL/FixJ family response regulator
MRSTTSTSTRSACGSSVNPSCSRSAVNSDGASDRSAPTAPATTDAYVTSRPALTERVLRGLEHMRRDLEAATSPDPLPPREIEILRLIAGGYSNREIAQALGTAEGTVKNHASSILSKLGVRDRTRAVLRALELGYI